MCRLAQVCVMLILIRETIVINWGTNSSRASLFAKKPELQAAQAAKEKEAAEAEKRLLVSEETIAMLHRAKNFALRQSALMWEHCQGGGDPLNALADVEDG